VCVITNCWTIAQIRCCIAKLQHLSKIVEIVASAISRISSDPTYLFNLLLTRTSEPQTLSVFNFLLTGITVSHSVSQCCSTRVWQ